MMMSVRISQSLWVSAELLFRIVQGLLSPLSPIFTLHSSLFSSQLSTSSSQVSDPTQSEANPQHSIVVECKVHDLLQSSFIHFSFCPAQWSANDDAHHFVSLHNLGKPQVSLHPFRTFSSPTTVTFTLISLNFHLRVQLLCYAMLDIVAVPSYYS